MTLSTCLSYCATATAGRSTLLDAADTQIGLLLLGYAPRVPGGQRVPAIFSRYYPEPPGFLRAGRRVPAVLGYPGTRTAIWAISRALEVGRQLRSTCNPELD